MADPTTGELFKAKIVSDDGVNAAANVMRRDVVHDYASNSVK